MHSKDGRTSALRPLIPRPRPRPPRRRLASCPRGNDFRWCATLRRPKARAILDVLLPSSFELRGDRSGEPDDTAVVVRIGSFAESQTPVVAIGTDASGDGRIRPAGFRKAIRAIELAGRFHLPVLTIVDTRGADPLPSSEGGGVASAIAHTFLAMLECHTATLAAVTGEGGSGGALALAAADRVVAWENAVFSVIAPEGAAAILYRDAEKAPGLADQLGITVPDLSVWGSWTRWFPSPRAGYKAIPRARSQVWPRSFPGNWKTL